ncbi:MAG TPA: DUF2905 domain-containing protein [Candidatus Krumholzibacteria bacterium]|nr:DUF2905 domain-containing protein [Candidatus Krumholzibacteria bacterium]HPD73242.1 DUF2905 domain-containing protein [Candidatus Krumholzibacteria bacterium]HRY40204.1 DUF2905 domain-containing protein [Candidatus Krumholzibacteria bacterium]
MTVHQLGRLSGLFGLLIVMVGLLVWSGALNWFGRLPGDLRIERPRLRLQVPWVSLLLVSIAFNALVWCVQRWLL